MSRQRLAVLRIHQAGKGLHIALLTHMPIGRPGQLPPRHLVTGLGHAREPEINAIGQYRSKESASRISRSAVERIERRDMHILFLRRRMVLGYDSKL